MSNEETINEIKEERKIFDINKEYMTIMGIKIPIWLLVAIILVIVIYYYYYRNRSEYEVGGITFSLSETPNFVEQMKRIANNE